jgi:hypothetical protein
MDKILLADTEYSIVGTKEIKFLLPYSIEHKNIGIISQLPTVGIIYNGDCEGYQGTFDEISQTLTLTRTGVNLGTSELSIILIVSKEDKTSEELREVSENTRTLHIIAELLIEQNKLLREMF